MKELIYFKYFLKNIYISLSFIIVQGINLSHPFHMHGYAFYVMGMGTANVSSINWKIVQEMDKRNLVYRCFNNPVRKDTIAVPFNGYVVLRFRADNPGKYFQKISK